MIPEPDSHEWKGPICAETSDFGLDGNRNIMILLTICCFTVFQNGKSRLLKISVIDFDSVDIYSSFLNKLIFKKSKTQTQLERGLI